jgi:hypothetical protein
VKYFVGFIVICCTFPLISYNFSYVRFTPEYSGEKFQRIRIGPISAELPASYSYVRQYYFTLGFERQILSLREYQSPDPCDLSLRDTEYNVLSDINNLISSGENKFISTADNHSINYSLSEIYQVKDRKYAINIYFDGGCAILAAADIRGFASTEEEERAFRGMVNSFLTNYQWLGNDSAAPRGFKTRFGVIKKNTDFKITAGYYIFDGEKPEASTSELIFNFLPEKQGRFETEFSEIETELSIVEKFKAHIHSRYLNPDSKILGYAWHESMRNINFLKSYSGFETRAYQSINNGESENLLFKIYARGGASDNCYSDEIKAAFGKMTSASLIVDPPFNRKSDTTLNVLYGYWDKIIQSSECMAF